MSTDAQGNHKQKYGFPQLTYLPYSSLKSNPALTEMDDFFFWVQQH